MRVRTPPGPNVASGDRSPFSRTTADAPVAEIVPARTTFPSGVTVMALAGEYEFVPPPTGTITSVSTAPAALIRAT